MAEYATQNRLLLMEQIIVKQCGTEACEPAHQYGPAVRDHYLIHYVASGKGTFISEAGTFTLCAGQGFLILPGQVTVYKADAVQPWTYGWVGYTGNDAEMLTEQVGLSKATPVFTAGPVDVIFDILKTMEDESSMLHMGHMSALGGFFRILPYIDQRIPYDSHELSQEYFEKAQWYMEGNYFRPILISDIASFVGLSRSQLFRVFIAVCGCSPKESLTKLRMHKARALLESHTLYTADIAASVGMPDTEQFVRKFKQYYGVTPSQWKKAAVKSTHPQEDSAMRLS